MSSSCLELEERKGIIRAVDAQLGYVAVDLIIEGHPERFSFPVTAVLPAHGDDDEPPEGDQPWAGEVSDNTVLKAVLKAVGAGRPVSVHLVRTTDDDGEPLLFLDVVLLDPADQNLQTADLLALQTLVRDTVFSAVQERAIVIAQVLPLEASAV
jgi:hypothetical protein